MRHQPARRPGRPTRTAAVVVAAAWLAGCTGGGTTPPPDADRPERAATELAAGLARKDLTAVEFVGAAGAQVQEQFRPLVTGMGPASPTVTVAGVQEERDEAVATLDHRWTFPGVPQPWTYQTRARLATENGRWKTAWQPDLVQPQLTGDHRLSQRRQYPERGELLGEDGADIVTERAVVRIGIDKARVSGEAVRRSATRLARLVDVDADGYARRVADAGPQEFVEAIVLRADADERPATSRVTAIPGALAVEDTRMLPPTRDFARPLIGTVGQATKETVDASQGAVVAGDEVGLSGLQQRYDTQLRGTPGVEVRLLPIAPAGSSTTPGASATPSPVPTPTSPPVTAFEVPAVPGGPLTTTLNVGLQRLAERTLADTDPASALVAVRPSTGVVLAAASGPGSDGQNTAMLGQVPPGSTFKIVSALALLRAGLEPGSRVRCPATLEVDGRTFRNYRDYPSSARGTIDLETAVAQSCNTAFVGQRDQVGGSALGDAAASLGLGRDYEVGYGSFFGAVPQDPEGTELAAATFGQGEVQASPLAMAAVMSSVVAGQTVVPRLVDGVEPEPQDEQRRAEPLTSEEVADLRRMLRSVVTEGSGRRLADLPGPAVLAKTGTAEYGDDNPRDTHAWMVGAQGDLAVAVFVQDGESGSATAGPLLESFLAGAR